MSVLAAIDIMFISIYNESDNGLNISEYPFNEI